MDNKEIFAGNFVCQRFVGNSVDKLRHTRSVAYSVERVLLSSE